MEDYEDDSLSVESSLPEVEAFSAGYQARLASTVSPGPMPDSLIRSYMLGWRTAQEVGVMLMTRSHPPT